MGRKVAILGGGNGGVTAAADLSLRGHCVTLFELEQYFSNLVEIEKTGGVFFNKAETRKFVPIHSVTNNLVSALEDVEIIMLAVPSIAIEFFAKLVAKHLKEHHRILLNGATAMSSYRFAKIIEKEREDFPLKIGETASLTYASRVIDNEVHLSLEVKKLLFSAYPSKDTEALLAVFSELYPSLTPAQNVWETLLHNGNPETHAGPSLLNAGRIEYTNGEFYLYQEGITPSVSNVIKAISNERKQICDALQINYKETYERMLALGYSEKKEALYQMYNNSNAFKDIKGPLSLTSRYFTEDISDGLVLWASLAKCLGVHTPNIDAIIILYGSLVGEDFKKVGLTMEKLGLDQLNAKELIAIV